MNHDYLRRKVFGEGKILTVLEYTFSIFGKVGLANTSVSDYVNFILNSQQLYPVGNKQQRRAVEWLALLIWCVMKHIHKRG